jgi:scyllo-inositol 2-dehydrogenase (NADP+)
MSGSIKGDDYMDKLVNVGLIGYGLGGRVFHAPIISSITGLKLYKVYATKPEYIKDIMGKYEDVKVVSNIDDVFLDENIELIVIAAPNLHHYELANRALECGKNVLVEKPFTVTSQEADKLIELAITKNKVLTIHQNRRYDSDFKTVEKIINSNILGELVEYEAHMDRFNNQIKCNTWKEENQAGSGLLYNLGSHLIDQAQYLFGLPEQVFGDLKIQRPQGKIIDSFEVILSYPKLKVTLKAGLLVKEPGAHFTLLGTKGSFIKHGLDTQEEMLVNGHIPNNEANWGKEPESIWGRVNTEVNGLHIIGKIESETGDYREFYKNVYLSILGEEKPKVTSLEARNTIRIIELALQSNTEKQWIRF